MQTRTLDITPEVIDQLDYKGLCSLADFLNIVNPKKVNITGALTLDDLGNVVSVDAKVGRDI